MIGIVNADMFGSESAPGEHVDWSAPDVDTAPGWAASLGQSVADYAEDNPHMIVFIVDACDAFGIGCGGSYNDEGTCSTCGAVRNG